MDPATAAGVALSAVSLAIQVFHGARKGFELFEAAALADQEYASYQLRLQIEFDRLKSWGRLTGLLDGDERRYAAQVTRQNAVLVVATLSALQSSLKDLRDHETKWEYLSPTASGDSKKSAAGPRTQLDSSALDQKTSDITDPSANTISPKQDVQTAYQRAMGTEERYHHADATHEPSWKVAKRRFVGMTKQLGHIASEPSRLKWAVRDSKKFKSRLDGVSHLISYLQEMLGQDQMQVLIRSNDEFKLILLQLTTNVREMKALMEAGESLQSSQTLASRDSSGNASTYGGTTLVGEASQTTDASDDCTIVKKESSITALWKAATQFSITACEQAGKSSTIQTYRRADITKKETLPGDNRQTASIKGLEEEVWIEWKQYSLETVPAKRPNVGVEEQIPEDTVKKVERLIALLQVADRPSAFCVPQCVGYFDDNEESGNNDRKERFGLIFQRPETSRTWPPRSLISCFENKGVTLRTRVMIAQKLSSWLMYLMAVNWLHKGLRSASVIFFVGKDSKALEQPYVSEFEYSRSTGGSTSIGLEQTDTKRLLYVHPDYLGLKASQGFQKTYDVYSLGIILIEIAYWKAIDQILEHSTSSTTGNSLLQPHTAQATAGADATESERGNAGPRSKPQASSLTLGEVKKVRDRILKGEVDVLEHVEEVMGEKYAAAVRACLVGPTAFGLEENANQKEVTVAFHLQRGFIERVVDVLQDIFV